MCLAVPAQVISRDKDQAIVDLHGNRLPVSILLTPHVTEGDWVLVHAGFALQHMDTEETRATFAVLDDVAQSVAPETSEKGKS